MRRILVALTLLLASSVAAMAQTGPGMMHGQMMGPDQGPGMMGPGGMHGATMGQGPCQGMMGGQMMPCMMMGQMSDGTMPAHARGCFGMAGGMMSGQIDLSRMQETLGLTAEQTNKLKAIQRPLQKEAIQVGAAIRVADLDLADLLSADKVDLGAVEGKLKELGALRTGMALAHVRAAEEVKKIVPREQLEKFQGACQGCGQGNQPGPPPPEDEDSPDGGGQHQGHHPGQ
jgi:Spy/CpxP family protein refolding chaperone